MAEDTTNQPASTTPPVVAAATPNTQPEVQETPVEFNATAAFERALEEAATKPAEATPPEPKKEEAKPEEKAAAPAAAPEKKEEPKPAADAKAEDTVSDDELQPLPHDKPKTQARIKTLHGKWKTAEEKATSLEAKVRELEEKTKLTPAQTADLEALKKQADEARAKVEAAEKLAKETEEKYLPYRRQYEVERSPEVEERYVKPAKAAEETIAATLKNYGLGEATLKEIEKHGGLAAFTKSKKTYTLKDADDQPVTVTASQVVNDWLGKMDFADAEKIRSLVGEQEKLALQRGLYIDSEKAKAREYFDGLTKKQQEEQASLRAQQEAAGKEVKAWIDTQFANDEYLKDDPALKDDQKAERAAARERVIKYLSGADRATLLAAARDAAVFPSVLKQIASRDAEIAALKKQLADKEAELDKTKTAGSAVPAKSGRLGSGGAPTPPKQEPNLAALLSRDGGAALAAAIDAG